MTSLLLIGCGKMGSAMLEGWLEQGIPAQNITLVEPNMDLAKSLAGKYGVWAATGVNDLSTRFSADVVVLAVKPQVMEIVLPPYKKLVDQNPVFLSIAAGKTLQNFQDILGPDAAVVRAMPNTPASVGRGITVGCPNENVTDKQKALCDKLLSAVGLVEWVDNEADMDAVTAVSGSGPAYIFLLAEAMGYAGRMAGLNPEMSDRLARATVAGAGELLHQSNEAASTLRENVTSPGGTTAAALEVLMGENGMKELMTKAIDAATKRSRELAN